MVHHISNRMQKSTQDGHLLLLLAITLLALSNTSCRAIRNAVPVIQNEMANAAFYQEYSQILGYELQGTEHPELVREVSTWLGTPHLMGGTTRQGADCSGFVGEVFRTVFQINLPRTSAAMALVSRSIPKDQLQDGDLVFFITRKGGKVSHVGIYLSNGRFVHVSSRRGVMVSRLNESFFVRSFYKAGRVR
ncbi:MAG TPA: hypothetical protein DCM62_04440 [Bacteroidales bacterium]|nr:hypothetical protein [Bacteroidales bacterium]